MGGKDTREDSTWWRDGASNIPGIGPDRNCRAPRTYPWRVHHDLNQPPPDAMSFSADALSKMSEVELLAAYAEARRQFVERKFMRDTQRARLA
jgi:hypothetical protein